MKEEWREIKTIENLKNEIWKDICEIGEFKIFTNYQVSNMGRIKSKKGIHEKLISQHDDSHGYLQVNLCSNGKQKTIKVHRLVGLAFVQNDDKENKKELNHINENKIDNRAENLEWCDRTYNVNYGNRTKKQIENNNNLKRKIICIELNMEFDSIKEACKYMNGSYSNLMGCLCHIRNQQTAFGYHWKYKERRERRNE